MRKLVLTVSLVALTLSGCSGGSNPTLPDPHNASAKASDEATVDVTPQGELLVGGFRLHVNPTTLHAEIIPPERHAASQPPQNLLYDLDISAFLTASNLRLAGLELQNDDDIRVLIEHKHPFAAPNVTQPITAANRADLSYSGRLLMLADFVTASATYAGTTYTFDPLTIKDSDGYLFTGDLLLEEDITANLFPYVLLVDEALDNRDVSNGGNPMGSYSPGTGGWQRDNLGPEGTGWTGYDVLHAGQTTNIGVTIARETLVNGPIDLEVAIMIKYIDPRGTGNRNFRFPFDPTDTTQFAYRMPHGAMDVSLLRGCNDLYINEDAGTIINLDYTVRDWDAKAAEAGDGDLSDETDVSLIRPGASGIPTLELIADTITAPVTLTPGNPGASGQAGDEFHFEGTLQNTAGGSVGDHFGLFVLTDPENADPEANQYRFGVDPETIDADPFRALPLQTFLPTRIVVQPNDNWVRALPAELAIVAAMGVGSDRSVIFNDSFGLDLEHGLCDRFIDYDSEAWATCYDTHGNRLWSHEWDINGIGHLPLRVSVDDDGNAYLITWFSNFDDPAEYDVDFDPTEGTDIRGVSDNDVALMKFSPEGNYLWTAIWDSVTSLVADFDANAERVLVGLTAFDPIDVDPGPGVIEETPVGFSGTALVSLDPALGTYQWHAFWETPVGTNAIDNSLGNRIFLAGSYADGSDFDPGPGTLTRDAEQGGAFLLEVDTSGNYVTDVIWDGPRAQRAGDIAVQSDRIIVTGEFEETVDFDPGPGSFPLTSNGITDFYATTFQPDFTFEWAVGFGGDSFDGQGFSCYNGADDSVVLIGWFDQTVDFDPGPGEEIRTNPNFTDGFVLLLDSMGLYNNVFVYGDPGSSVGLPQLGGTDIDGNIYIHNFSSNNFDFDRGPGTYELSYENQFFGLFLQRLNPDGTF